jgi:hypothetical protein
MLDDKSEVRKLISSLVRYFESEAVFVKIVVAEAPYFFAKTRADYQKSQSGYSPGLAILRC